MKSLSRITMSLLVVAFAIAGCAGQPGAMGWVNLLDGDKGLDNFNRLGDANWRTEGGAIVADKGKGGHLVSKSSYKDFQLRAEFWAADNTNSGIFVRVSDRNRVGADNSYEVNIWDTRPGAEYRTGAIVNYAAVPSPTIHKAGGKWNVMEVYAKGDEITVSLNGVVTASTRNGQFKEGPFTLQFGNNGDKPGGPIKWRKVDIKPL